MELISIIVPVYKIDKNFLDQCVTSILEQTYSNFELILVDDGSPDACPGYCDEYATLDKRVQVVHKRNGGVSSARNAGIDLCKGDIITFVDADDWVDKHFCQKIIDNMSDNEIIIFDGKIKKANGIVRNKFFPKRKSFQGKEKEILQSQAICFQSPFIYNPPYNSVGIAWGKAYRSYLIKDNNIRYNVGQRISEDTVFNLYAIEKAEKIEYIDIPLYYYRTDNVSASRSFDINYIETNNVIFNSIYKFIDECNKKNTDVEKSLYYRSLMNIQLILRNYIFAVDFPAKKRKIEFHGLFEIQWLNDAIRDFDYKKEEIPGKLILQFFKWKFYRVLKLVLLEKNRIKRRKRG